MRCDALRAVRGDVDGTNSDLSFFWEDLECLILGTENDGHVEFEV